MKTLKLLLCGLLMAIPVFAEESEDRQTATSLHYVSHELDTRQNKLSAGANKALTYTNAAGNVQQRTVKSDLTGGTTDTSLPQVNAVNAGLNQKQDDIETIDDHTAVTYTGQTGTIGQKGIYQSTGTYAEQSDNLIDAKTFNAALKNGLDSEFVCSDAEGSHDPVSGECWLWVIHNTVTANGILPNGYTPVEYIEFTGSQWIDTGILPSSNTEIRMTMLAVAVTGMAYSTGGSNSSYNGMYYHINTGLSSGAANMNGQNTSFSTSLNTKHTIIQNRNNVIFDNVQYSYNNTVEDFIGTNTLWVGGGSGFFRFFGYVYSWRISENGTPVQNLIPAIRNSDNTIGMYDTVSNEFFGNAGEGTFRAGPPMSNSIYLPQGQ